METRSFTTADWWSVRDHRFGPVETVAAGCISLFVIYTTAIGSYPVWIQYEVVLALVLTAIFAARPGPLAHVSPYLDSVLSWLLIAASTLAAIYMIRNHPEIAAYRQGVPTGWDLLLYGTGILVVLEGVRRAEGPIILVIALAGLVYMLVGPWLPGLFQHRGMGFDQILEIAYSQQGIFGVPLGSIVEIVYIYVIFGVALRVTGAADFFDWFAAILTLGRRSGSAQCAIVASALFGSINGSSTANVVANGSITINMMHRAGYSRAYAAALEASSSVVGQVMPPVMGVGAFVMAEITGIPYPHIMLAALLPAMLFILSLSVVTALEAGRLDLKPLPILSARWTRKRVAQAGMLIASFTVLLTLLFSGYSVDLAGLAAICIVVGISLIEPSLRPGPRQLTQILVEGGREGLAVAVTCAAIGILIGAMTSTGLGIKIGQTIVLLGEQHLALALVLAAACSLLLGMGLPTAASYLMVILIAGPAIVKLGIDTLGAHLFVFYFAVMSAITPPVALAVFAAAAIAQERMLPVAGHSLRLCMVAFIFPFIWIYQPELLLQDVSFETLPRILAAVSSLILAVIMLATVQVGYFRGKMHPLERALLAIGTGLIFFPGWIATGFGFAIGSAILARRIRKARGIATQC